MSEDRQLRRAFVDLADATVAPSMAATASRRAAGRAIRRARQRQATRVAVPLVAVVCAGTSAAVTFRGQSATNRVAATSGARHAPATDPAVTTGPTTTADGARLLASPVTIGGWTITSVPAEAAPAATVTSSTATFGPGSTTCGGAPTLTVTVFRQPQYSVSTILSGNTSYGTVTPLPIAGGTGVALTPATSGCHRALEVLYQPHGAAAVVQITTTAGGVTGAEVVAEGLRPAT